ncbi:hypothetical protein SUGI_0866210 [Cryptomeria japonica]|nr:hypothetical protein SUGI_0866210 [Cryptomeria japonica]
MPSTLNIRRALNKYASVMPRTLYIRPALNNTLNAGNLEEILVKELRFPSSRNFTTFAALCSWCASSFGWKKIRLISPRMSIIYLTIVVQSLPYNNCRRIWSVFTDSSANHQSHQLQNTRGTAEGYPVLEYYARYSKAKVIGTDRLSSTPIAMATTSLVKLVTTSSMATIKLAYQLFL